jgi:MFS family permease
MMSGFGESYLGAFAIFLKATNAQIAVLAALPQLLGAWFQFVSVWWLHRLQNRKALILGGVLGQALSWLFILAIPFVFREGAVWWLIGAVTVYFVLGHFVLPPWNSLMGDLVKADQRGRYFGRRNRAMSIAAFASLGVGGMTLHRAEQLGSVALGFAVIFLVALLARLGSAFYLSRMIEPPFASGAENRFSLWQFLRDGRRTNFGRFVGYIAFTHFAVQVSGPFIAPYLLRDLGFTYLEFMFATAATVVAQLVTLPGWGRFCDRFGNKHVLTVTGLLVPVIPLLWLCTTNFYGIVAIQMFAGVSWAGFSLAMGNFVFDTVSPPKRAQCVAVYHSANAVGIFLGASLGGLLIPWLPTDLHWGGVHLALASNIQILFVLSAVLRLAVSLKFLPMIREARTVSPFVARDITARFFVIGLQTGAKVVGKIGKAVTVWVLVVVGQRRHDRS